LDVGDPHPWPTSVLVYDAHTGAIQVIDGDASWDNMAEMRIMPSGFAAVQPHRWWILLLIVIAAGAVLRLWALDGQPLWLDEAGTIHFSSPALTSIWSWATPNDNAGPPLYYSLMHQWMAAGTSEFTLRLPSVIAGILVIPVVYALGFQISGHRVAVTAAALTAISPLQVAYSQEVRGYIFLALFAAIAMWACATVIDRRPLRYGRATPFVRVARWPIYAVAAGAALLTHNTAVLIVLAANAIMLLAWFRRWIDLPTARVWLVTQVLTFLIWLAWIPGLLTQMQGTATDFWITVPTGWQVARAVNDLYAAFVHFSRPDDAVLVWAVIAAVVCPLLAIGLWALRAKRHFLALIVCFAVAAPVGQLAITFVWRPVFREPSLIWASIPICLALAAGVTAMGRRTGAVALAVLVLLSAWGIRNYFVLYEKDPWDQVASYVASEAADGDIVLLTTNAAALPFDYYFQRLGVPLAERGLPVDFPDQGWSETRLSPADAAGVEEAARPYPRVWLVYHHEWFTDPSRIAEKTLDKISTQVTWRKFGEVSVGLYEMPPKPKP
jgi:mannosyltransferase